MYMRLLCRSVDRDNPFKVDGQLRRKADLMLARSRITRSELHIVDPDLTQSDSTTHEDDVELATCQRRQYSEHHERPASECLLAERLPLCDVPAWTRTVNGDPPGVERVECHVERLNADGLPPVGRAVTVLFPDRRKTRACCTVS